MTALRAWFARGPRGVGAELVSFATLRPPAAPNACLACPPGDDLPADLAVPVFAASPPEAEAALRAVAAERRGTHPLAAWPRLRQFQWVARTPVLNFPDLVAAEVVEVPGGCSFRLLSRSLIGRSDFGANRRRLAAWIGALRERLPAAAPGAGAGPRRGPEDAPPPPLPLAIEAVAPGQRLAFAWDDPAEVPALLLHALASGAARAHVVHPNRPHDADALLREAAARLSQPALADALLEAAPCAPDREPMPAHADTSRPRPWWLRAPLEAPDIAARIGGVEVVVDGLGLMQWWNDPPRRLRDLAATGAARLLLRTCALPPTPELQAAGFSRDALWYASRLEEAQAAALDATLRGAGVALEQFRHFAGAMPPDAARAAGLHGPWMWFMGEGAVERLLADAGWRLRRVWPGGLFPVFEAARA